MVDWSTHFRGPAGARTKLEIENRRPLRNGDGPKALRNGRGDFLFRQWRGPQLVPGISHLSASQQGGETQLSRRLRCLPVTCDDVGEGRRTVAVNVLYTLLACDIVDAIAVLRHFNRRVRTTVEEARCMSGKLFNVEQWRCQARTGCSRRCGNQGSGSNIRSGLSDLI